MVRPPYIDDFAPGRRSESLSRNKYSPSNPKDLTPPPPVPLSNTGINVPSLADSADQALQSFINGLLGRNIYNPSNPYNPSNVQNQNNIAFVQDQTNAFDSPVQTGINVIGQKLLGGSFDIKNNIIGRVLGPNTRMIQIANARLLSEFGNRVGDRVLNDVLPQINVKVLFDKDKTNDGDFIFFNEDAEITQPESKGLTYYVNLITGSQSKRDIFQEKRVVETIFGKKFTTNQTNKFFLANTGKLQKKALAKNLSENVYSFSKDYDEGNVNLLTNPNRTSTGYISDESSVPSENLTKSVSSDITSEDKIVYSSFDGVAPYETARKLEQDGWGSTKLNNTYLPEFSRNTSEGQSSTLDPYSEIGGVTWGKGDRNNIEGANHQAPTEELNIRRGLLYYTNQVFRLNHPMKKNISQMPDELNSCEKGSKTYDSVNGKNEISRGMSNIHCSDEDQANKIVCRSFTKADAYNSFNDLMKNGENLVYKDQLGNSVLEDTGLVKIGPYQGEDIRKYMFSFENLAWVGNTVNLPDCEIGDFGGRIMWFPPYGITISENITPSYNSNEFLGRPEPIYTYKSTERKLSLSFKVLVDHASIINKIDTNEISKNWQFNSFNAGCYPFEIDQPAKISEEEIVNKRTELETTKNQLNDLLPNNQTTVVQNRTANIEETLSANTDNLTAPNISYYFENDVAIVPDPFNIESNDPYLNFYETQEIELNATPDSLTNGSVTVSNTYPTYNGGKQTNVTIKTGTKLFGSRNASFFAEEANKSSFKYLIKYLNSGQYLKVEIFGNASRLATSTYNERLSKARADNFKSLIERYLDSNAKVKVSSIAQVSALGETESKDLTNDDNILRTITAIDSSNSKESRVVMIKISPDVASQENERIEEVLADEVESSNTSEKQKEVIDLQNKVKQLEAEIAALESARNSQKCFYFEKVKIDDPFVFKQISKRIKYYSPVFHSQTPEDLNSRLTFLHQLTRPGSPLRGSNVGFNTIFGRPPVSILRIGDFFHTKCIINNVSINYENPQWDLNPEGIGVQPMIADVSMDMFIIGGSSLQEPINQLQNALAFNFYANTHVYEEKALVSN